MPLPFYPSRPPLRRLCGHLLTSPWPPLHPTSPPLPGADYDAAPDLDHANPELRKALTDWLRWLQNDIVGGGGGGRGHAARHQERAWAALCGAAVPRAGGPAPAFQAPRPAACGPARAQGFEGWRLDFAKGYAARFVDEYIAATVGGLSVSACAQHVGARAHGGSARGRPPGACVLWGMQRSQRA
jgi:hypothetical protein